MAKLETVAQQQQQQAAPAPSAGWMSKLRDAGTKVRIMKAMNNSSASAAGGGAGPRSDSPAESGGVNTDTGADAFNMSGTVNTLTGGDRNSPGLLSVMRTASSGGGAGGDAVDTMSIREHKARMEHSQAAAERQREQALQELRGRYDEALNTVLRSFTAFAELRDETAATLADAYEAKATLLADAAVAQQRAAAAASAQVARERDVAALELEGLRERFEADRRRSMLTSGALGGDAGNREYAASLAQLMQESDKYIQLIRSASRHPPAAAGSSASSSVSPNRAPAPTQSLSPQPHAATSGTGLGGGEHDAQSQSPHS